MEDLQTKITDAATVILDKTVERFRFELNDQLTRDRVKDFVTEALIVDLTLAFSIEALRVKCNGDNNPPESIDKGVLVVDVSILAYSLDQMFTIHYVFDNHTNPFVFDNYTNPFVL